MSKRDYYEVLGLGRDASEKDVKKAYKRLAMKYHPDRTKGDKDSEEKFKEVKEAYEVLNDAQKKAAYDQFGHAGVDPNRGGGGGHQDFGHILGDVFGDIFGGGGGRRGGQQPPQRGSYLRYNMELTLEETLRGISKEIKIPSIELQEKLGTTKFYSITTRLFKIKDLEQTAEDYGQMVRYNGWIEGMENCFKLDEQNQFQKAKLD